MSELSTAIGNIYNRLADSTSTPTFHPASADLFTDWNVQAGDVVTVKSDSESYQVPVYSMKMRWSGAPRVLVESTGNPEREPLPAIKRREYSANSTNYKEQKALKSGVAGINNTMQNAGLYVNDQGVWAFANDPTNGLGATFSVQAGKIGMVVEERDGVNVIKSASIITAINNDTHKSEITLNADQIYLNGQTIASQLTAMDATLINMQSDSSTINQLNAHVMKCSQFVFNSYSMHLQPITVGSNTYRVLCAI